MIITIDGPAGTGKSSVAKKVAEALGFAYFDTGGMYRCLCLLILENKVALDDTKEIEKILENFTYRIVQKGSEKYYYINDVEVTTKIRSEKVNAIVSQVSAYPFVRTALLRVQRDFAKNQNAVFEGRDLGTVIFPHADVKIYLDASPKVRAERRLKEIEEKKLYKEEVDFESLLADIIRRDTIDSTRAVAPLKCPVDAHVIDTSYLTINQVVENILQYAKNK